MLLTRPWSFEGWITLSTGCNSIWWIMLFVSLALIHWIAIYPLDSVICLLYNWAQFKVDSQCPKQSHKINRVKIRKIRMAPFGSWQSWSIDQFCDWWIWLKGPSMIGFFNCPITGVQLQSTIRLHCPITTLQND